MHVYLHKIHTNTNQKLNNLNIKFIEVSKTLQKHCLNVTLACVCWSDKTFFPPILGDTCNPAILEIYTCLCAPPYLVWEQCSCPVSGGNTWTRSIAYCRTSVIILSLWLMFYVPLAVAGVCLWVCVHVSGCVHTSHSLAYFTREDREMRTHRRQAGKDHGARSILKLALWPLRQPEISFCGSCGLWSCTAATTQLNNAHFKFYLWTEGKVLEQGVWTDQWPVLLDEHRVDKGQKGGQNNSEVTDNVTTESSLVPHWLCIPSFLCCCSPTLFRYLLSSPWNKPLSLAAAPSN